MADPNQAVSGTSAPSGAEGTPSKKTAGTFPSPIKIAKALSLPASDEKVSVKGVASFSGSPGAQEGWLSITDTTDTLYAWGPDFKGEGLFAGVLSEYQGRKYLKIERIRKIKKESLVMRIIPFIFLIAIPIILYFGVTLSLPDFHIADLIGPKEPYPNLSDLKRDKLTSYRLEAIWHEGNVLCAELRNTGKMVIPKSDLDKITFSVDNSSIYWNRSTLPEKLMIWKRMPLCLCTQPGDGCPSNETFFSFEKVGENYPTIAIELRPWFGEVRTGK